MRFTAVVDRIEEGVVVLLVGPNEVLVNIPFEFIPQAREGAILAFTIEELPQEEHARRSEVEGLLAKLMAKKRTC